MANRDSKEYIAKGKINLKDFSTTYDGKLNKDEGKKILKEEKEKLHLLQEKLYADGSQSLLIVLQAMDAAGKDSLIEHVFGGINPQGCEVTSFKTPSSKEYRHDFLWRHYVALPEKGKIGIFNRSHYENVLVCKVHPEYILNEKVWDNVDDFDEKFWDKRYQSIENFEKTLAENGTTIIKIFLNVSLEEQKQRFLDRINEEDKNWKFAMADLSERKLWPEYMKAYEETLSRTSKDHAPWYIIPADKKWFARMTALDIIIKTLENMNLEFPEVSDEQKEKLQDAKETLEKE